MKKKKAAKSNQDAQPDIILATLHTEMTDSRIVEMSITLDNHRRNGANNIFCLIDGFDDDKRELWEISEVKILCKRLVKLGFISPLNAANLDIETGALGALEIWLFSEGMNSYVKGDINLFKIVLCQSNQIMDQYLQLGKAG